MSKDELNCWNCGLSLHEVPRPISRHEHCKACFEALHCCRLCRYYRTDVTGQCDEQRADPPVIKENANFCDWFQPDSTAFDGQHSDKGGAARGQLDALFGDSAADADDPAGDAQANDSTLAPGKMAPGKTAPSKEDAARSGLDDLFSTD